MKRADADLRILWSYIGGVKPDFILTKTDEITVSLFNEKNYQMGQNSWKVWIKSAGKEKHTALLVENLNGRWRVKEFSEVFTKLVEDSN